MLKTTKRLGFSLEKCLGMGVLIFIMLLSSVNVAVAMPVLKTYGQIDKNTYENLLLSIPTEYYDDLKYIKVFDSTPYGRLGQYWYNAGIDIFWDSGINILIHELAHHCQMKRGDIVYEAVSHQGKFNKCEDEIWESLE